MVIVSQEKTKSVLAISCALIANRMEIQTGVRVKQQQETEDDDQKTAEPQHRCCCTELNKQNNTFNNHEQVIDTTLDYSLDLATQDLSCVKYILSQNLNKDNIQQGLFEMYSYAALNFSVETPNSYEVHDPYSYPGFYQSNPEGSKERGLELRKERVNLLLDQGADINVVDNRVIIGQRNGNIYPRQSGKIQSVLEKAIQDRLDTDFIKFLIETGADFNRESNLIQEDANLFQNVTPIFYQFHYGDQVETARLLIDWGADLDRYRQNTGSINMNHVMISGDRSFYPWCQQACKPLLEDQLIKQEVRENLLQQTLHEELRLPLEEQAGWLVSFKN